MQPIFEGSQCNRFGDLFSEFDSEKGSNSNSSTIGSRLLRYFSKKSRDCENKNKKVLATQITEVAVNEDREPRKTLIAWAADIHFDHADEAEIQDFFQRVNQQKPSILLLAGDIEMGRSNPVHAITRKIIPANGVIDTIRKIRENIECQIYFICGNHDFYFSSIEKVRSNARRLSNEESGITYLHESKGVELDDHTVLIGHDGWADSRSGDFWNSDMALTDFFEIEDFNIKKMGDIYTAEVKNKLEKMGDESSAYINEVLPGLLKRYEKVVFVTHVPPFREASWHEGKVCGDKAAPFFVNQTLGEALMKIMRKYPKNQLLVLCGHTHTASSYQPLPNLKVLTAGADYGSPLPQTPIQL